MHPLLELRSLTVTVGSDVALLSELLAVHLPKLRKLLHLSLSVPAKKDDVPQVSKESSFMYMFLLSYEEAIFCV